MQSFDFLMQLLRAHGVIESRIPEAQRLWDTYTIEQQRQIYGSIKSLLEKGKYVCYDPIKAIRDNVRKPAPTQLSFREYYERYGTTQITTKRVHYILVWFYREAKKRKKYDFLEKFPLF